VYELEATLGLGGLAAVSAAAPLLKPLFAADTKLSNKEASNILPAVRNPCLAAGSYPPEMVELLAHASREFPANAEFWNSFDSLLANVVAFDLRDEGVGAEAIVERYQAVVWDGMPPVRRANLAKSCAKAAGLRHERTDGDAAKAPFAAALNTILRDGVAGFPYADLGALLRENRDALDTASVQSVLTQVSQRLKSGELTGDEARQFLIYAGDHDHYVNSYGAVKRTAKDIAVALKRDRYSSRYSEPKLDDVVSVGLLSEEFAPVLEKLGQMRDDFELGKKAQQEEYQQAQIEAQKNERAEKAAAAKTRLGEMRADPKLKVRVEEVEAFLDHLKSEGGFSGDAADVLTNERVQWELGEKSVDAFGLVKALQRSGVYMNAKQQLTLSQVAKILM